MELIMSSSASRPCGPHLSFFLYFFHPIKLTLPAPSNSFPHTRPPLARPPLPLPLLTSMDFTKPENAARRVVTMREKPTQKSPEDEEGSDDNAVAEEAIDADEKKHKRLSSGGRRVSGGGISCQAEKCTADLTEAKRYHRRHKVCEFHAKAPSVLVSGLRQRFCQQCSRFHELSEFDETKRSCRRRLAGHNERRRKSSSDPQQGESGSASSSGHQKGANPLCRPADHERASRVTQMSYTAGNPTAYKHFQIG